MGLPYIVYQYTNTVLQKLCSTQKKAGTIMDRKNALPVRYAQYVMPQILHNSTEEISPDFNLETNSLAFKEAVSIIVSY